MNDGGEESSPVERPLGFAWGLSTFLVDVCVDKLTVSDEKESWGGSGHGSYSKMFMT